MNNKAHLRPKDFDSDGDIIPMACKEEKGDLISREALKKALEDNGYSHYFEIFDIIDNAPAVDIKDQIAGAYNEGYMCGSREAEKARPQGECENCDFRKFSEKFVDGFVGGFVELMNKNGIASVEQYEERPKGEWIQVKDKNGIEIYRKILCSHCNEVSVEKYSFCPNCGADMRKGGAE